LNLGVYRLQIESTFVEILGAFVDILPNGAHTLEHVGRDHGAIRGPDVMLTDHIKPAPREPASAKWDGTLSAGRATAQN